MSYICLTENDGKVVFPENKIVLLNGTELDCYPKAIQPQKIQSDNLKLDTTGEYLSFHRKSRKQIALKKERKEKANPEKDMLKSFFLQHAVDFYQHAERILSDSRMFLAPVPITNGLAYTGTSGLSNPTLGIYIEWWLTNERACRNEKEGLLLTYHIAGSPLSGRNNCSCVNSLGETEPISYEPPFSDIWHSFMAINTRYTEAKQRYEAYSLYEVWEILSPETFHHNSLDSLTKKTPLKRAIAKLKSRILDFKYWLKKRN
ncbi:MAG: hypothetical protein MJZ76_04615 [Bacteroidales bacterium]|nr:hypothetical protein [Bacteroidales bacterium]